MDWRYDRETCTLYASGTGMLDEHPPCGEFDGPVKHIVLEEGITGIGSGLCLLSDEKISLPSTLEHICQDGLDHEAVVEIDPANPHMAVHDGYILSTDGKTLIWAHSGKSGEYDIPDGVETLSSGALRDVRSIRFPGTLRRICEYAVVTKDCETIRLPPGPLYAEKDCIEDHYQNKVHIADLIISSETQAESDAFDSCGELECIRVTLSDGCEERYVLKELDCRDALSHNLPEIVRNVLRRKNRSVLEKCAYGEPELETVSQMLNRLMILEHYGEVHEDTERILRNCASKGYTNLAVLLGRRILRSKEQSLSEIDECAYMLDPMGFSRSEEDRLALREYCAECATGHQYTVEELFNEVYDLYDYEEEVDCIGEDVGECLATEEFPTKYALLKECGLEGHPLFGCVPCGEEGRPFPPDRSCLPFGHCTAGFMKTAMRDLFNGNLRILSAVASGYLKKGDVESALGFYRRLCRVRRSPSSSYLADDDWDEKLWYAIKNYLLNGYCSLYWYIYTNGWYFDKGPEEARRFAERYIQRMVLEQYGLHRTFDRELGLEEYERRYRDADLYRQEALEELAFHCYNENEGEDRFKWGEELYRQFPDSEIGQSLHILYGYTTGSPDEDLLDGLFKDYWGLAGDFCRARPEVPDNLKQAERFYRRAVSNGSGISLIDLGDMILFGEAEPEEADEAEHLFMKALEMGRTEALPYLARIHSGKDSVGDRELELYYSAISAQVIKDNWGPMRGDDYPEELFGYIRDAAEYGYPLMQTILSLWADDLNGDFGTSAYWMEKALESKEPLANLIAAWKLASEGREDDPAFDGYLERSSGHKLSESVLLRTAKEKSGNMSIREYASAYVPAPGPEEDSED